MEYIRAIGDVEPGEPVCTEAAQRLMAACDTIRKCASGFTDLSYREQAAEAHAECAHGMRYSIRFKYIFWMPFVGTQIKQKNNSHNLNLCSLS